MSDEVTVVPIDDEGGAIRVVQEHANGFGSSTFVNQNAFLSAGRVEPFEKDDDHGFRVDFKATSAEPATLFNYGAAQRLFINDQAKIEYEVVTENGAFSVTSSDSISVDQWTTVAGRYVNNTLELYVDGRLVENTTITGRTIYMPDDELEIGKQFEGWLSCAKFFDWSASELLALGDTGENQVITVQTDASGKATIPLRSLGRLNRVVPESALPMYRVAVSVDGDRQFASVLSSDKYLEIAAFYVDHIRPDKPEYQDVASASFNIDGTLSVYSDSTVLSALPWLVADAHAFGFSDVGSWIWSGINWIIPLEDIYFLGQQLFYLATGDPQFDAVELALASIGTITLIPLAKPLKVVVNPLRNLVRFSKRTNPKFLVAFGSVVGGTVKKAWDTKSFQVILNLLPFMIIAGELMLDEQAREEVVFLIKTIESESDFLAWVDYLRLPADGWEGDGEPPEVELGRNPSSTDNWLVPNAYAMGARRLGVAKARILLTVLRKFGGNARNRREVIEGITATTNALKKTDLSQLRKTAFSPQTVVAGAKLGKNALSRLYRKSRNLRMSPFAIAGIITYLESRRDCDPEDEFCEDLEFDVSRKLDQEFYRKIITDSLIAGTKDFVGGFENGAAFHMAVTAFYHLSFEAGADEKQPIDIERQVGIQLLGRSKSMFGNPYQRRTDIVLAGARVQNGQVLVETKSFKRPYDSKRFARWNLGRGADLNDEDREESKAAHKQFFLDRVAAFSKSENKIAGDIQWWFHDFDRKTIDGYGKQEVAQAFEKLKLLPTDEKIGRSSLGLASGQNPTRNLKSKVQHFTVKKFLFEDFKDRLFEGVDKQLVEELVFNTLHDQ